MEVEYIQILSSGSHLILSPNEFMRKKSRNVKDFIVIEIDQCENTIKSCTII